VIGAVLVGLVVVTALVSLVWTPFDPEHAGAERLLSPGAEHCSAPTDSAATCSRR
jgi:hypothetical protein